MVGAANGEQALLTIAERAPDLILLDLGMPEMASQQLAGRRRRFPVQAGGSDGTAAARGQLATPEGIWRIPQKHGAILEQQVQVRTADLQHLGPTTIR